MRRLGQVNVGLTPIPIRPTGSDSPSDSQAEQTMPITWLDLLLLGVMLISGLLAMIRGFMREILSITAWAAAAVATLLPLRPAPADREGQHLRATSIAHRAP